jgi:hypothetical protein
MPAPSNQDEVLWIEPHGKDFVIVRACADGSRHELAIPERGLAFLARMLPQAIEEIHARRRTPSLDAHGIKPIHAVPAPHVSLNTDVATGRILISFIDLFGNTSGYALEPDVARQLGEGLLTRTVTPRNGAAQ